MRNSIKRASSTRTYITAFVAVVLVTCLYINLSYIPKITQHYNPEQPTQQPEQYQQFDASQQNIEIDTTKVPITKPLDKYEKKIAEKIEEKIEQQKIEQTEPPKEPKVARARIERMKIELPPQTEGFRDGSENLEVKFISGVDPKIMFFDSDGNLIGEPMKIAHMDTPSMHELLTSKGIMKKTAG